MYCIDYSKDSELLMADFKGLILKYQKNHTEK